MMLLDKAVLTFPEIGLCSKIHQHIGILLFILGGGGAVFSHLSRHLDLVNEHLYAERPEENFWTGKIDASLPSRTRPYGSMGSLVWAYLCENSG